MNDKVQYVTSDLLTKAGIRHGWFMRYGGVSSGLFESLNGKKGSGDTDKNVNVNRARAFGALCRSDLPDLVNKRAGLVSVSKTVSLAHITHAFKTKILPVQRPGEFQGYDASFTDNPNIVLSQTTADCASIIIADLRGSIVSLIHGSWHTLSAKIICDTVAKIKTITNSELIAGIGPMICKNCYEFGPEANNIFQAQYLTPITGHSHSGRNTAQITSGKDTQFAQSYLVDLKSMVIDQLKESGIKRFNDLKICTLEDDRFFSHRKNGTNSGRLITLAMPA